MRLGDKRIVCTRSSSTGRKKVTVFLTVLIIVLLLIYSCSFFLTRIRPVMISLAVAKAHNLATLAINDAVISIFSTGDIKCDDIVTFVKNEEGSINAAQSNLEGVNRLKAMLTQRIQEYITKKECSDITIPFGALFADDIFSGLGPYIHIPLMPYGISSVDFISDFSETGINQTRLSINLEVTAEIGLLIPTAHTSSSVKTTIPVIQTIIVGDVPGSYTNVDRFGEEYEDDVLQLAE